MIKTKGNSIEVKGSTREVFIDYLNIISEMEEMLHDIQMFTDEFKEDVQEDLNEVIKYSILASRASKRIEKMMLENEKIKGNKGEIIND